MAPLVVKEMGLVQHPIVIVSLLIALIEDQIREAGKLGVTGMQLGGINEIDILDGRCQLVFGSHAWWLNEKWRSMLASEVYLKNLVGIVVDEVYVTYKCNKECPTCRKKLVSKRSLRPDPNFDALISKIYPSRDEYEAHQERVLARISKHNNQQALSHSIEEGLKIQAMTRLQRGKRHTVENGSGAEDNGDSSHCSNASVHSNQEAGPSIKRTKTSDDSGLDMDNAAENGGGDSAIDGGASEIELVFRPHPTLMEKDDGQNSVEFVPRYIKTSGNATVDHLSKYLAVRLALEELRRNADASPVNVEGASEKQYTIYIPTAGNQFTVLNGSFSLELVSEKYWKVNKPMELYFAPTKEHK